MRDGWRSASRARRCRSGGRWAKEGGRRSRRASCQSLLVISSSVLMIRTEMGRSNVAAESIMQRRWSRRDCTYFFWWYLRGGHSTLRSLQFTVTTEDIFNLIANTHVCELSMSRAIIKRELLFMANMQTRHTCRPSMSSRAKSKR